MKLTQLFQTGRISRALLIAASTMLGIGAIQAQNFFDSSIGGINLGYASGGNGYVVGSPTVAQRHWAIFALSGGVSVTETTEGYNWTTNPQYGLNEVYGNIGAAGAGSVTLSATEINGSIYRNTGTYNNSGGTVTGSNIANDAYLAQAAADATAASAAALSAAGTLIPMTSISLSAGATQTINAVAAVNVLNLTDIIMSGLNTALTLNGTANQNFVINISRYLALSSSAKIQLSGGLTAQNVLFNVYNTAVAVGSIAANTANAQDVTLSGGAQLSGIILAPTRNVKLTGDATVFGEVIGKSVSLSGSSNVFNPIVSP